jgi:DNA-binding beta-propeller fold protein YncE
MAGWKRGRWVVVVVGAVLAIAVAATVTAMAAFGGPHAPTAPFAYVANSYGDTVTPVNLTTGRAGAPIMVGTGLSAIAITPDGRTAYVVGYKVFQPEVVPVDLTTGRPGKPILLDGGHLGLGFFAGVNPDLIAITPDGKTAYVVDASLGAIVPINLATNRPGTPVTLGSGTPVAVVISRDGKTAYVVAVEPQPGVDPADEPGTVIAVNLATGRVGTPIAAGTGLGAIAIAPDGGTAYVVENYHGTVVRINLATGKLRTPVRTGTDLEAIAIAPDGRTAYVADDILGQGDGTVIPVNLATGRPGTPIKVGLEPAAIAITRLGLGGR